MKLTPAAANLLIAAAGRADCEKRLLNLCDTRMATSNEPKQIDAYNETTAALRRALKL